MAIRSIALFISVAWALDDPFDDGLSLLQLRAVHSAAGDKYCEGIIEGKGRGGWIPGADGPGEAQTLCDADPGCKGIYKDVNPRGDPTDDRWRMLGDEPGATVGGGDYWSKGTSWGAPQQQESVLVKNCEDSEILACSGAGAATTYPEGEVVAGRVGNLPGEPRDQESAERACNNDPTCIGIWQQEQRPGRFRWYCYFPIKIHLESATFRKGWNGWKDEHRLVSVRPKTCATTTTTAAPGDEAAAIGDPHVARTDRNEQDLCCDGGKCQPC